MTAGRAVAVANESAGTHLITDNRKAPLDLTADRVDSKPWKSVYSLPRSDGGGGDDVRSSLGTLVRAGGENTGNTSKSNFRPSNYVLSTIFGVKSNFKALPTRLRDSETQSSPSPGSRRVCFCGMNQVTSSACRRRERQKTQKLLDDDGDGGGSDCKVDQLSDERSNEEDKECTPHTRVTSQGFVLRGTL
ncbi:hypothetical protein ALC60_11479 [Trachymyrmex zeteki]|uniref:Uncharacterized protein n=1 Tax=Mycetomoellerius zeteki TaxID=64791 RepID=A0A151WNC9_9HYME|nr:hypothetical protein ALC60_11479 [Trachymyrmex zeteki]